MPHRYSRALPVLAPLLGSALLVGFAIYSLPWTEGLLLRPRTPYDHGAARWMAPAYSLLKDASAVIPPGASVVARAEPPDPALETWNHRIAVSLLPGRQILPSALYGQFAPEQIWRAAEFIVVVGGRPAQPPGDLVLETAAGSVWRRRKP